MANTAHAWRVPGSAGVSHRPPGRPLTAPTGTSTGGDLQTIYAVLDAYPGDLRWPADGLSPVPGKVIDPPGFTGGGRP